MMAVIYPEEMGRGSPANTHERSLGVLWLCPSQIVGLLFILSVGCAWGRRREGAVGASDLPGAAVWVGTAECGGAGKGAGHQLSVFLH